MPFRVLGIFLTFSLFITYLQGESLKNTVTVRLGTLTDNDLAVFTRNVFCKFISEFQEKSCPTDIQTKIDTVVKSYKEGKTTCTHTEVVKDPDNYDLNCRTVVVDKAGLSLHQSGGDAKYLGSCKAKEGNKPARDWLLDCIFELAGSPESSSSSQGAQGGAQSSASSKPH
ncbi:MAG: hypothetical protein R3A80_00520 [Bdellovibrionota bacterium]